jgi:carbonic anhydrase
MLSTQIASWAGAAILLAPAISAQSEWSYAGATGPEHWGDLKPEYAACKAGKEQSPIDIRKAKPGTLPTLQFDYKDTPLDVLNTGHTIQVNDSAGSSIIVGGERYQLRQFHFHHPSEEHIKGKAFDLVIHLVHANSKGDLTVVAVLARIGAANETLQKIRASFPERALNEKKQPGVRINASDFLPSKSSSFYTFRGSLTTPPCTEGVTWFVLKTPIEVSPDQVRAFATLFPHNARPIQPLGTRIIRSAR